MGKKILSIMLIIFISFIPLTGCWDYQSLTNIGIAMALGIDRDKYSGKIILTVQIVRPSALKKQNSTENSPVEIITSSGDTVFEAIRNIPKEFDRKVFFAQVKVIVVSEEIANKGLKDVIDAILRTNEIRRFTWIIMANGTSAKNILGVKKGVESIQGAYMAGIIREQRDNTDIAVFNLLDFIKKMDGDGINPVTATFQIFTTKNLPAEEKNSNLSEGLKLSGAAVFKKDKFIGYLNSEDTRGFNLITGNIKNFAFNIPSIKDETKSYCIEVKSVSSKIIPNVVDGKISIGLNIKVKGNIAEVGDNTDISKVDEFEKVNLQFTKYIKKNINSSIIKIQKNYRSDILGFGSTLSKKYPKEWIKIKDNWDSIFPNVSYTLKVETYLNQTGLQLKPIKPSDQ